MSSNDWDNVGLAGMVKRRKVSKLSVLKMQYHFFSFWILLRIERMSLIANTVPESIVGNDAVKIDENNFLGNVCSLLSTLMLVNYGCTTQTSPGQERRNLL
ncbi:hypothetical protein AUJ42_00715 [Candidatus Collierbacteria bacterium CG1_02_44_10]|uniref:Uncharacterized protein n=2 Tax=Candidatus Collieribacteriota TaxID=1752725 RepID=A0A2M8BY10_9BACT|nr:MAG: hypothetical protein AUJ42_00715 [Candidatus Collierbacteria bacterium CG1_02_44_10]PIZ24557.1 MAG: hypothetical protein COY48_02240 [Candidatus Collierbacteria bacterium CG_4_10_14_0_8_um_filter_43_86]PJB48701.1 MAG: hypothetical protein CO104_00745 [Candidatus Collierbacteria bacterium CG_4_9_14_3_um_filter_43_16]